MDHGKSRIAKLIQQNTQRSERDQKRLSEIREKCKHSLQQPVFQHGRKHPPTVRECDTLEAGGWVYPDLICIYAVEPENEQKVKGNE